MYAKRFSTDDQDKPRQLQAWRDWYADSYEVSALQEGATGFAAKSEVWTLHGVGVALVSAPSLRASRTKLQARRDPVDHICLTIGHQAATRLSFGAESMELPAGTPFIFGLDQPHASERHTDIRWQFYIARDQFNREMAALDAVKGRAICSPLKPLLVEYLRLVVQTLPSLTPEAAKPLPPAIVAMIVASVAPTSDSVERAKGPLDAARLEKVRQAVQRNLFSPRLGPEMLSAELGLSRSNLYRLLEPEGGVANFIKHNRLMECFEQLSDPRNTRAIGEIARSLRLLNQSNFGRSFKQKFGATPGEIRAAAQVGAASILPKARSTSSRTESFRTFLRDF